LTHRLRHLGLSVCALALLSSAGSTRSLNGTQPPASAGIALAAPDLSVPTLAAGPAGAASVASVALTELVRQDPMTLPRVALQRYEAQVCEYRCTLYKRERIQGKLGKVEQIDVKFRDKPYSIFMKWQRNEDEVKRALFIDSPQYVDDKGRKVAKVEPAGAIVRLFISEVEIPIHGKRSREASRRTIDQFGFKYVLDLLIRYNALAEQNGVLDYRYAGVGRIDGRPTFIFERYLPYHGEGGKYPDAKLVIHIDQEWLLPTALYSYADRAGRTLLGSYVFTNVKLNPGFSERDFRF
jgi:hypothetical protein